jgi:hypothetical protein
MIARGRIAIFFYCFILGSCASQQDTYLDSTSSYPANLPQADITLQIPGLRNCSNKGGDEFGINTREPVTVIVHGCYSSAGRFRALADVFAFHGQQTVCFNYDDRDRLGSSSARLITALEALSDVLVEPRITLIGHSQGGLVARHALIEERPDRFDNADVAIDLATISAPFGGIEAAAHCGSTTVAWLSLGTVKIACQIITGEKYKDIPANSAFIQQPGTLLPAVNTHLKIVTDEANTCREYSDSGDCVEDDFVFSVGEQNQSTVDRQPRLSALTVKAGHVEIVGENNKIPVKLIGILQQQGYLRETPPEARKNLAQLLANLYLSR